MVGQQPYDLMLSSNQMNLSAALRKAKHAHLYSSTL